MILPVSKLEANADVEKEISMMTMKAFKHCLFLYTGDISPPAFSQLNDSLYSELVFI